MLTSGMDTPIEERAAVCEYAGGAQAIARELDNHIQRSVLVFGSLPPGGRDLDLLARPPEQSAIAAALRERGFRHVGNYWATFRAGAAALVELVPADAWRLPAGEAAALFADGEPIVGMQRLLRPAPHHELLIVARRHARTRRKLSPRLRERIGEALSRNPDAWLLAAEHARPWRATAALRLLAKSYRGGRALGAFGARALSAAELVRVLGERPAAGRLAARRALRPRRPAIVAFSGLDGAGKSSQARALQENLQRVGIASEVVWPPAKNFLFQMNPRVKSMLHGVLERIGRSPQPDGAAVSVVDAERPLTGGAGPDFPPLPSQRNAVTEFLAAIVAISQVLALRRAVPKEAASSTVLIYDRYALDAVVYIRDRWGQGRPLRWQSWLIARLVPRPAIAYLLELDPQTAFARKRDFPLQNLRDRAALYRELHRGLGVRSLDATRPPQELSEQIAFEAWAAVADDRA